MASSSDWKAPASLPPWAEVDDRDDKNMKNVKSLLSAQYALLCDMKSQYLAKKRYSEELERFVTDNKKEVEELNNKTMQQDKEIEKLKEDVQKRDSVIYAQKNYIETLHNMISKQ